MSVAELLEGKCVCVCGGAGGVGKTTTSAALALGMAAHGLKVAVVTIDPARRLANALGLQELSNQPMRVPAEQLAAVEMAPGGELWAMMLDPKRTFDELIERLAPSPVRAEEIKANRVYRELSTAVSGSQEFTAIAKLYDLQRDGGFDLLVLDTPPSRHALDFLDAPGRLTSFLEGRALNAFLRPTGLGVKILGRGASPLLGALRRLTGIDLIGDLSAFFTLLGGMTDDFSERAIHVQEMLHAPSTAFLLITSAQDETMKEGLWFAHTLQQQGFPFTGTIVNRFHHDLIGDLDPRRLQRRLADALSEDLAVRVIENLTDYHVLAARDERNLTELRDGLGSHPVLLVPQFDGEVHDVEGLLKVHRYLFATEDERAALIAKVVA